MGYLERRRERRRLQIERFISEWNISFVGLSLLQEGCQSVAVEQAGGKTGLCSAYAHYATDCVAALISGRTAGPPGEDLFQEETLFFPAELKNGAILSWTDRKKVPRGVALIACVAISNASKAVRQFQEDRDVDKYSAELVNYANNLKTFLRVVLRAEEEPLTIGECERRSAEGGRNATEHSSMEEVNRWAERSVAKSHVVGRTARLGIRRPPG